MSRLPKWLLVAAAGAAATWWLRRHEGPGHPPLDTPKRVADDVWVVDSLLPGLLGRVIANRMTVLRLPGGDLILHSPTRYGPGVRDALAALGPVRHLVAPNDAHWIFVKDWQAAYPEATTWTAPGLRRRRAVRRAGLRIDRDLPGLPPTEWGDAIGLDTVPGGFGFREVTFLHRPSRTLVLTDLVVNLDLSRVPLPLRPVIRRAGMAAPDGMPAPYVRMMFRMCGKSAKRAAARLLDEAPERVIFAHGDWFRSDGTARLRTSLRWLLPPGG